MKPSLELDECVLPSSHPHSKPPAQFRKILPDHSKRAGQLMEQAALMKSLTD